MQLNWILLGFIGISCLCFSPYIQFYAAYLLNFCDVQGQIFKDELIFNKTVSHYFQGFEEILLPCVFT